MYAAFQWYGYTLAQLEKHQLWSRMDAKIRNMGDCDHIDALTFGPHRRLDIAFHITLVLAHVSYT